MRITVDLSSAIHHRAGIGRYAEELTWALLASRLADEQFRAFGVGTMRQFLASSFGALPFQALPLSNKEWRARVMVAHHLCLAGDALIAPSDVFIATDHVLPYLKQTLSVFILYDLTYLSFPATHLPLNRWFLRWMMPRFLRTADAVVTISESSRRDALNHYPFAGFKLHVIYGGVNPRFHRVTDPARLDALRRHYQLPDRFVLYVGTLEPRKNLPTLLQAFQQAALDGVQLVIAGKRGWLYGDTLAQIQNLGLTPKVRELGFVPEGDLPGLYTLAEVFAFPSLYEGFGLPVLEALACGTPVIASNTSSLPEVAGSAALLVPPDDVRGWANALIQVMQNPALRADLQKRGPSQAALFTWETAAQQMRMLYREAYARRHNNRS